MDIGAKIKQLRTQKDLTLEELASRCELTKGFLSQVERNLTSPSIATLNDILEACARVTDYYKQDGCSAHDEMLYRVKPGDSPYSLGNDICLINGIDKTDVLDSNEILLIKPLSGSFSKDADINIEKVNEINHTL